MIWLWPFDGPEGRHVQVLRHIEENWPLEMFTPDPNKMRSAAAQAVLQSMQRSSMENPVACLALFCVSYHRYQREIGLDIEAGIKETETTVKGMPAWADLWMERQAQIRAVDSYSPLGAWQQLPSATKCAPAPPPKGVLPR